MAPRTIFLSRLIGLFCIGFALTMATHPQASAAEMTMLAHQPAVLLLLGIIGTVAGLALVLSHNNWSGGAPTVVVTVLGWIILFRGLVLLLLTPVTFERLFDRFHIEQWILPYLAAPLVLGIYLTWVGFARAARRPEEA